MRSFSSSRFPTDPLLKWRTKYPNGLCLWQKTSSQYPAPHTALSVRWNEPFVHNHNLLLKYRALHDWLAWCIKSWPLCSMSKELCHTSEFPTNSVRVPISTASPVFLLLRSPVLSSFPFLVLMSRSFLNQPTSCLHLQSVFHGTWLHLPPPYNHEKRCVFKNLNRRAGKMAQMVKCLPCKHGGYEFRSPELMLQNKKLNMVASDVTLAQWYRDRHVPGAHWPANFASWWASSTVKDSFSKDKVNSDKDN